MDWSEIRVFVKYSQDERLKANPDYFGDLRKRLYRHRVKREELHATPESFLYFGKTSSFRLIDEFKNAAAPVNVIYSQWLGYLDGSHADYFGSDESLPTAATRPSTSCTPTRAGMPPSQTCGGWPRR